MSPRVALTGDPGHLARNRWPLSSGIGGLFRAGIGGHFQRNTQIYQVTGKIEYFQAAIDFLVEHECVPEEVEEDANPEGQQELPL